MSNISWNKETKQRWLTTMREHQQADRFVQGAWLDERGDDGVYRGCFFGCAMQTGNNPLQAAIDDMQLPAWLIHTAESIFEGLPVDDAKLFPVELLEAIPTNVDLTSVECKMHITRLEKLSAGHPSLSKAIDGVIDCYRRNLNGDTDIDWDSAAEAARAAAEATAEAAWAAEAAEWAAEAARAAARAARAARAAFWQDERDTLITLLREVTE